MKVEKQILDSIFNDMENNYRSMLSLGQSYINNGEHQKGLDTLIENKGYGRALQFIKDRLNAK